MKDRLEELANYWEREAAHHWDDLAMRQYCLHKAQNFRSRQADALSGTPAAVPAWVWALLVVIAVIGCTVIACTGAGIDWTLFNR